VKLLALAIVGAMGTCGGMNEPPLQAPPPPTAEPPPPRAPSTDSGQKKKDAGAKPDATTNDDLDLG
jgi:hypothetical protein